MFSCAVVMHSWSKMVNANIDDGYNVAEKHRQEQFD